MVLQFIITIHAVVFTAINVELRVVGDLYVFSNSPALASFFLIAHQREV